MLCSCPQKWWKEEEIEAQVLEAFRQINLSEKFYKALKTMLEKDFEEKVKTVEEQIQASRIEYSKNQDLIKALVHKIANETDKEIETAMREELKAIRTKQELLKEEIRDFEEAMDADTDKVVNTLRFCGNLEDQYKSFDREGKRELLSSVFSKLVAYKGEWRLKHGRGKKMKAEIINFTWKEPFNTLLAIDPEAFIAYAEADERVPRLSLTKIKEKKTSLFP